MAISRPPHSARPPHPDRPFKETLPLSDPDGRAFFARWLAHVEAGRIGGHLRPTASLLEADNSKISDETRAAMLENERVLRGR